MVRRLTSIAALVACAGIYIFAATERATFILTDGERKSGTVVFHGDQHENLINGYLNLGVDGGKDMTFPIDQVAVIDFVGGQPPATELAQLGTRHMLVTRNGATQAGRFVNMTGGDTLFWENEAGQRQQYAIHDVSRVYLNPQSARIAFNYTAPAAPAPAAAAAGAAVRGAGTAGQRVSVRVDAQQPWTDTGLTVNQGDRVSFQASGQVQIGPTRGETATPDGIAADQRRSDTGNRNRQSNARDIRSSRTSRDSQGYDRNIAAGALVGRVGNSAPFGIGTQTQPLVMPASGRLMLGVNDDDFSDNSGAFTVVVSGGTSDGRTRQNWRDGQDQQDQPGRRDRQDRQNRQDRGFRDSDR